ncbi:hypothetical protein GCM10027048_31680 [Hymenobacter coalescens]
MSHFDSTIRVGYYDAFSVEGIDHTYAILAHGDDTYAFPCFGDFATATSGPGARGNANIKYPVDMWTPYAIGSQNVGSTRGANLYVALGMAQFSLNPAYNWKVADWPEGSQIGGTACWAGIVYGVSGVCQQACNRVLWSTSTQEFEFTPVNWPPSFSGTYWVYGYWGATTQLAADILASSLVQRASQQGTLGRAAFTAPAADPDFLRENARLLRESLRQPVSQPERQLEIEHLLQASLAQGLTEANARPAALTDAAPGRSLGGITERDAAFRAVKTELDTQLLREEISHDEYAARLNGAFQHLVTELQDALPAPTFARLFPEHAAGRAVALINREQMPESYLAHQELAQL